MKTNIRDSIFETNSSSVHSLVLLNQELSEPDFRELRINKDGVIKIPLGYFGKEHKIYSSQKEKISYILTSLWCYFGENIKGFENKDCNYYWRDIKDAIIFYINKFSPSILCTDIVPVYPKRKKEGIGFDHQTYPEYLDDCLVDLYNPEKVVEFIFNKNIALETNSD